jgi:hypothetical protein
MAEKDPPRRDVSRERNPEADRGELTPPHGDELSASARGESRAGYDEAAEQPLRGEEGRSESTFGPTDRYANQDDPDAEIPVLENKTLVPEEELNADARRRRMEQLDNAAADDARMATRKREHSAD